MIGRKVVTAQEMARVEKQAIEAGASELSFMEHAGNAVAECAEGYVEALNLDKHATLLIGKGNNGGDAYTAGLALLEKNFTVEAFAIYPFDICSPLCKQQGEKFKKAGGKIHFVHENEEIKYSKAGIILDGLTGTGFKGKAEGVLAKTIAGANRSRLPILAIDIPSGVDGTSGEVGSVAIQAVQTIYLGLPKLGFFIGDGWNHVGHLVPADYGLSPHFIQEAHPEAFLNDEDSMPDFLPPIQRNRHKYQRGYVLALAGSAGMAGAAILSSFAALRAGAGIVRLFHAPGMSVAGAPAEIIKEDWTSGDREKIFQECARADAMLIGPGMGRSKEVKKLLKTLLSTLHLPCVIDADALFLLSENLSWKLPKNCILTPHRREMERLLADRKLPKDEHEFIGACQQFVDKKRVTLVLKGAPTFVLYPQEAPIIIPRGDPGMATAGSGDVLTGIIAALLAQGLETVAAAVLGVYLHALAGEAAAFEKTSYSMVASDIIESLPEAFSELILKNSYTQTF